MNGKHSKRQVPLGAITKASFGLDPELITRAPTCRDVSFPDVSVKRNKSVPVVQTREWRLGRAGRSPLLAPPLVLLELQETRRISFQKDAIFSAAASKMNLRSTFQLVLIHFQPLPQQNQTFLESRSRPVSLNLIFLLGGRKEREGTVS